MHTNLENEHVHVVQFFADDEALATIVAEFLGTGLKEALPAVLIATPAHQYRILNHLYAFGCDVPQLESTNDLIVLDANAVMATFVVNDMPNQTLFQEALLPVIEKAAKGWHGCIVRIYGDMTDLLWKAGHEVAAFRLEDFWNELGETRAIALLCGYSMANHYRNTTRADICSLHTNLHE